MDGHDVECLYFLQFLDPLQSVEFLFHALDGHLLARLEGEGGEDHREGAAALLVL